MSITISDFLRLRSELPVVDVRSENEFSEGHIRGAVNIPLLNNGERVIVGTTYRHEGQHEAIMAGFHLVGPRLRDIIIDAEMVARGRELLIHCWRGGMRSENFAQFARMAGIKSQTLDGGYKSYRHEALESFKRNLPIVLLTGCTGSGKSDVLRALARAGEQVIDLEHLASHKGSAFGGLMMKPQPTTEQFQNELFEEILRLDTSKRVWVEDESLAIGKIFLPKDFWLTMERSPLVQLHVEKGIRIQRLVNEYGPADKVEFLQTMEKIVKKLGGQHFNAAREKLMAGDMASTIDILLTYYDKAYLESIGRRKDRIELDVPWNGVSADEAAGLLIAQIEETSRSSVAGRR